MDRRLAAVLAADMVGYSRLMETDEQGTLARLRTHRIELIDPSISRHRGTITKAAALDDNDADVHRLMAAVEIMRNNLGRARYHQERALSLNPNYDLVVVQMGELLTWAGQPEEGAEWIEKAMRLNPHHPARFWSHLGKAHFCGRHYEQAIEDFHRLPMLDEAQHAFVAACHGWLGNETEARRHADAIRSGNPDFKAEELLASMHYGREEDLQHFREGLEKAGLAQVPRPN